MAQQTYYAKIQVKTGGAPITIEVQANGSAQAKKLIECRPEFKSFVNIPQVKGNNNVQQQIFSAKIQVKTGGSPIIVETPANDSVQAKKIIESRPEFKSFINQPQRKH